MPFPATRIVTHELYADQLRVLDYGYALYDPDPGVGVAEVQIGDVGFIFHGRFKSFASVFTPDLGIPAVDPREHEVENLTGFDKGMLKSNSVNSEELNFNLSANEPTSGTSVTAGFKMSCKSDHGASLITRYESQIYKSLNPDLIKDHFLKHCRAYFNLAKRRHFSVKHLNDIILVTGRVMTADWATIAFHNHEKESSASFDIKAATITASGTIWGKWSEHVSFPKRHGPTRAGAIDDLHPIGPHKNQCIFIDTFRAYEIAWFKRLMALFERVRSKDSGKTVAPYGIVHIEEQPRIHTQRASELALAASERGSSSGGEGSNNLNFMAQRPSFEVQLPYSAQFVDRAPYGSGDADDGYTLEFDTLERFMEWRNKVEEEDTVEFVKGDSHSSKADPQRFKEHVKLVCARHNRSGRKTYVKKYPERQRKVPSRKLGGEGCPAFISYKTYHNNSKVRAMYHSQHSHQTGLSNLQFTRRGRKAAEEARKNVHAKGLYRANSILDGSAAAARLTSGSSTSSSMSNFTMDSSSSVFSSEYTTPDSEEFITPHLQTQSFAEVPQVFKLPWSHDVPPSSHLSSFPPPPSPVHMHASSSSQTQLNVNTLARATPLSLHDVAPQGFKQQMQHEPPSSFSNSHSGEVVDDEILTAYDASAFLAFHATDSEFDLICIDEEDVMRLMPESCSLGDLQWQEQMKELFSVERCTSSDFEMKVGRLEHYDQPVTFNSPPQDAGILFDTPSIQVDQEDSIM